jgi:hypothetical protein
MCAAFGCKSPYSSVVEHPLSKRKVGSSILPGGKFLAIVSRSIVVGVGRERGVLCAVFALLRLPPPQSHAAFFCLLLPLLKPHASSNMHTAYYGLCGAPTVSFYWSKNGF